MRFLELSEATDYDMVLWLGVCRCHLIISAHEFDNNIIDINEL